MKFFLFITSLFACTVIGHNVFAQQGCLNLVIEKKLDGNGYSLLFTVKNIGEDVIFEQVDLLPWQTNTKIFSVRLVPASNPETELPARVTPIETEKIVALFPRDTMKKEIQLSDRYKIAVDILQTDDLLFLWKYKPHQECPQQDGKVMLVSDHK